MKRKLYLFLLSSLFCALQTHADNALLVGSIDVQATVSESGGAVVSIPIDVPSGIGGMQPSLSLVYNSQGGYGIAGWGWSLSGISSISRTGSTIYDDNVTRGITFTSTDNLALDGQRLTLMSGSNLSNGATYRTAIETFNLITYQSSSSGFSVQAKSGTVSLYGDVASARMGYSTDPVLAWYLRKTTDPNGNYIEYHYTRTYTPNEILLSSIDYTGNTGVTPAYSIELSYISAPHNRTSLLEMSTLPSVALSIKQTKLLSSIIVKRGGAELYRYHLVYNTTGVEPHLSSVEKYTPDGSHYDPVNVSWKTASTGGTLSSTVSLSKKDHVVYADFTGDGKTDILSFENGSSNAILYKNNSTLSSLSFTATSLTMDSGFKNVYPLDYDGDGKMDFVGVHKGVLSYEIYYTLSTGSGFEDLVQVYSVALTPEPTVLTGDFDGDGRDEFIISTSDSYYKYGASSLTYSGLPTSGIFNHNITRNKINRQLDFNGNGRTDVFLMSNAGLIEVYELSETANVFTQIKSYNLSTVCTSSDFNAKKIDFGDLNGDGRADIVLYDDDDNSGSSYIHPRTFLSSANTFALDGMYSYYKGSNDIEFLKCADLNHDGLSDIVCGIENSPVYIGLNNGENFSVSTKTLSLLSNLGTVQMADFRGLGRPELIDFISSTVLASEALFSDNPNLVCSVGDGLGNTTAFTYSPLSDSGVYTATGSNSFPYALLRSGLYVASSITAPYVSNSYTYKNAVVHKQGMGFLGFEQFSVTDNLKQSVQTTRKQRLLPHPLLLPVSVVCLTTGGDSISKSEITYDTRDFAGTHHFWPYVYCKVSTDHLTTLSDTTLFYYTDEGNLYWSVRHMGDLQEQQSFQYTNAASWCKNKPKHYSILRINGEGTRSNDHYYAYDNKGNVIREVTDSVLSGLKLVHRYTYDTFGNVTGETVTDGTQMRTTSTTWAANGRYPLSSTDELGMTTTYTYNDTTGLLRSSVSVAGTTTYAYDAFGRPVQTTYPDGVVTTVSREYITGAGSVKYAVTETRTKTPTLTTYYNSSGMPLFTKSVGFANRQTYTACGYNTDGSRQYVSEPFYATSLADAAGRTFTQADATLYTYDAYGRTKTVRSPSDSITYSYGGLSTTQFTKEGTYITKMNSSGFVTTKTLVDDGLSIEPGLPIEPPRSHVDNSRRIHYTYYPTGQVKTVTPDGGATITLQYDGKGNRTSMADPDAGTVTDTYNAFGQVMTHSQSIHSGTSTTTYTYSSSSGQLLSETTVGSTTLTKTYTYHTTFKDLPVKIAYSATDYVAYTYDSKGRQTGCTRLKDGETVTDTYTYGTGSLVSQHNHNGKTLETFTYDTYGNQTAEGLTPYATTWQLLDVNARGQVLREQKGSVVTTYTYDNAGRMLSMKAPNIVNLTYAYDGAGNLLSKTDSITSQTVLYAYDTKNRLTEWNVQSFLQPVPLPDIPRSHPLALVDSTFTMTYDETTGNIIAKSDLGADAVLGYGETTAPHALDLVSGVATDWGTDAVAIGYTDFGKVSSITEGDWTYTIAYSPDGARAKSYLTDGNGSYTARFYGDGTEKAVGDNYNLDYLSYLCHGAIVVHHGTGRHAPPPETPVPPTPTAVLQGYYDAQGSLIALVDANGSVVQRYAYDPWGRRVDPDDWTQDDTQADLYHINRGYTIHEHLREFGLINMNGRVFDPAVAQFLSPDDYVQDADNWLNYNRYAYCLNNPLKYTDPSGEYFGIDDLIGMGVCGTINVVSNLLSGDVHSVWQGLALFGAGAVSFEISSYASPLVGAGFLSAANSAINQGFNNGVNNINWDQVGNAALMGTISAYVGGFIGEKLSQPISNLMEDIASPILRESLTQSTLNSASGFIVTTTMTLGSGSSWEEALQAGGKAALMGFATGAINGTVSGFLIAERDHISPWTGEVTERHHSFPKFLGGDRDQHLTRMSQSRHKQLHKDMYEYLKLQTDGEKSMRPAPGYKGVDIQNRFSSYQRYNAVKTFYNRNFFKYPDAWFDFYRYNYKYY